MRKLVPRANRHRTLLTVSSQQRTVNFTNVCVNTLVDGGLVGQWCRYIGRFDALIVLRERLLVRGEQNRTIMHLKLKDQRIVNLSNRHFEAKVLSHRVSEEPGFALNQRQFSFFYSWFGQITFDFIWIE
jgi:hypothetical protein